jgi:hypothetical protein
MTKNKLSDLNDHLFSVIERLDDESLTGDALTQEIARGRAITGAATAIIQSGELALRAVKHADEYRTDGRTTEVPKMLLCEGGDKS